MNRRLEIWTQFCKEQGVPEDAVPLFDTDSGGRVATRDIGGPPCRPVLRRSDQMEGLIVREVSRLVDDWKAGRHEFDGLIYMMFTFAPDASVSPLYIGKAESLGKGARNLSANIQNLHRDKTKFARWGDGYAYHIGDLSAAAIPSHPPEKRSRKYDAWADALFAEWPAARPALRQPVHFWAKAWCGSDVGIWREFGPTRLTFLEYLLIGVASSVFPESLLNREGQNRGWTPSAERGTAAGD